MPSEELFQGGCFESVDNDKGASKVIRGMHKASKHTNLVVAVKIAREGGAEYKPS